jgi:hypothetical protein
MIGPLSCYNDDGVFVMIPFGIGTFRFQHWLYLVDDPGTLVGEKMLLVASWYVIGSACFRSQHQVPSCIPGSDVI